MEFLKKLGSAFDWFIDTLAYLSGAILCFIMVAVTTDVSSRKLLGAPIQWVDDMSGYLLLFTGFLGSAWLLKKEGHVSVDVVIQRLKPTTQAWLHMIISVTVAVMCLVMTYTGVRTTLSVYRRGVFTVAFLEVHLYLLVWVIPLGFALLVIQFLRRAYKHYNALKGIEKLPQESDRKF
jgi:C4-dicarboxylate transporter, DctQ subunit